VRPCRAWVRRAAANGRQAGARPGHFYESRGLIRGWRTDGNQRRYAHGVLRHIAVIKVAQRTGIPLRNGGDALGADGAGTVLLDRPFEA